MHPAVLLLVRLLGALFLAIALGTLLAGCGGGVSAETACRSEFASANEARLSFDAPVGVLHSVAINPSAAANVRAELAVTLSGTGTHRVLLRLTSAAPGHAATVIGQSVEVQPGAAQHITLVGAAPRGGQVLSVAYAIVGTTAEGQTLSSTGADFDVCEPATNASQPLQPCSQPGACR